MLELDEGRVPCAYRDSLGYWTAGVGRLIDSRKGAHLPRWLLDELDEKTRSEFERLNDLPLSVKKNPMAKLTDAQIDRLLNEDIAEHQRVLRSYQPWVELLDPVRQAVLDDMTFNLGIEPFDHDGFGDWPNFLAQVQKGLYAQAAANMRGTLWAKQVGARAERLARMMETGLWHS